MIFYYSSNGSQLGGIPERIFQGSNLANTLYLHVPLNSALPVTVRFTLPNGDTSITYNMQSVTVSGISGVVDENGVAFNVWKFDLPFDVTKEQGLVTAQFSVAFTGSATLNMSVVSFEVEEGVLPIAQTQIDTIETLNAKILTKQPKTTYENVSVLSGDWTALSDSDPFTYQVSKTLSTVVTLTSIVELINDAPVNFVNYGFCIGQVSGQVVTLYAMKKPNDTMNFKVGIGG